MICLQTETHNQGQVRGEEEPRTYFGLNLQLQVASNLKMLKVSKF